MKTEEMYYISSAEISGITFNIIASHNGILKIVFNNYKAFKEPNTTTLHPDDPFMFNVFKQLQEYFNCERKIFDVPLDIKGSNFQKRVWAELLEIPYGKTVSYKFISEKIGNVKSIRAVGRANGVNPIPIIIPCHRVINSDGTMGGYSGGLQIKKKLLILEGSMEPDLFN